MSYQLLIYFNFFAKNICRKVYTNDDIRFINHYHILKHCKNIKFYMEIVNFIIRLMGCHIFQNSCHLYLLRFNVVMTYIQINSQIMFREIVIYELSVNNTFL